MDHTLFTFISGWSKVVAALEFLDRSPNPTLQLPGPRGMQA